jgi:hypothetical protein
MGDQNSVLQRFELLGFKATIGLGEAELKERPWTSAGEEARIPSRS